MADEINQTPGDKLATIDSTGEVPQTRIASATQAKAIYDKMFRADIVRAKKRTLVKGLVDGNPPYEPSKLKAAGRDYQCNVNWRIAESFRDSAAGAFYDVDTETPTLADVRLKADNPNDAEKWSRVATEHFHWLIAGEPTFDYHNQISIDEMVLYGLGPMLFQDEFDWRPISCLAGQLKVPERTKSDTSSWEMCCIEQDYLAHELYDRIVDEKAAQDRGWNVEVVKGAIMRAHPENQRGGIYKNWFWYQEQLKNGSLYFSHSVSSIRVVHLLFREFAQDNKPGRITHQIIIADDNAEQQRGFMYEKQGRYADWPECVHPMYYDRGNGGFHHSVTGMGVKMYAAMEYLNRSICATADKVAMPDTMFKPGTGNSAQDFSVTQYSDYTVISEGYDAVQIPVSKRIQETMAFNREIYGQISSNLSAYRSNIDDPQSGNPITATEVQQRASEEARLGKTQLSRRYAQRDSLFLEMFKRASDPALTASMAGGERAVEFRNRCIRDGVPELKCLLDIEAVTASRVVGQGSEFMREQALTGLMSGVLPMLPEDGRDNLICDFIATKAGQANVARYYPSSPDKQKPNDQNAFAALQVAAMKEGVPAVVTPTQNAVIYIQTFLKAGTDAINSIQQGGDAHAVAAFLELDGQAIAAHLQRIQADKSRAVVFKILKGQFMQLAKVFDQLKAQIQLQQQQQQREAQQQQMAGQNQNGDLELKQQKTQAQIQMSAEKHQQKMGQSAQSHQLEIAAKTQNLVLQDATTAAEIKRKNMMAHADSEKD